MLLTFFLSCIVVVSPTAEIGKILIITQNQDFPRAAVSWKAVLHRETKIKSTKK